MTEEEFKNTKERERRARLAAIEQKAKGRWIDVLNVWNLSHLDVSVCVGITEFLGMTSIHVTMWMKDGSRITREVPYFMYMRAKDPRQYIISIYDQMYKEGGKQDA